MYDKLVPNGVYHVFNQGNNGEDIFVNRKDYEVFIEKYQRIITPIAFTYAYCLMPNHFHLLVMIKSKTSLPKKMQSDRRAGELSNMLGQVFGNFFSGYTKSFNKFHGRKHKLFAPQFKRKRIENTTYFEHLIHYIHRNPVHHRFCYDLNDWKYSSYWEYLNNELVWFSESGFKRYFSSKEDFRKQHNTTIEHLLGEQFLLE